jgi:Flp pilus assembly protein TadG
MKAQKSAPAKRQTPASFLARLRQDKGGNVIALTAAAIIPLTAMVGGAVDVSRMYVIKSRLQSACDAAGLAGRRVMASGRWDSNQDGNATNDSPYQTAMRSFGLNFQSGTYDSTGLTVSFTETNGSVDGTASVQIPMTLMRLFGKATETISVSCESEMRVPNTDVMFVLDTTGSMNCKVAQVGYTCPGGSNNGVEDANSKMKGLRIAVRCFYQELSKLDAGEDCDNNPATPTPNTGLRSGIQLRFGFVPYTTNVNVGKLLPPTMFANSWTYESREVRTDQQWRPSVSGSESAPVPGSPSGGPSWTSSTWTNNSSVTPFVAVDAAYPNQVQPRASCTGLAVPPEAEIAQGSLSGLNYQSTETVTYPDNLQTKFYSTTQQFRNYRYRYTWSNSSGGRCTLQRNSSNTWTETTPNTTTRPVTWTDEAVVQKFEYKPVNLNISALKNGASWNSSVDLPLTRSSAVTDANGAQFRRVANTTVSWDGCIEERQTYQNTDGDPSDDWAPIPSVAKDMNIDLAGNGADTTTLWAPALPNASWGRYDQSTGDWTTDSYEVAADASVSSVSHSRSFGYSCPPEARKLQAWTDTTAFNAYLNGLTPNGNTYHDIGLLWGARFLSPTGIFAAENALTPQGASIQRHLIFMTDGDTATSESNYTAYGPWWWSRRQTDQNTAPDSTLMNNVVNARLDALCAAIKNRNDIQVWVVSYGGGVNTATEDRLRACASQPAQFFSASDTPTLIANFTQIAQRIADLRLTN